MNDYDFRFVTRTRYTDYKVYIRGGKGTISNREGFRPLRQKCSITEGEQCVCAFIENAKIYLVVSALDRHKTDERGRAIRFSFCQIFTDKKRAASAFIKIAKHWKDAENWLSRNLHDINEGSETESVQIDEAAFMDWLIADGEKFESDDWLERGKVRKWTKIDGEENYIPIGKVYDVASVEPTDDSSGSKKKEFIIAALLIAGTVIGGCYVYVLGREDKVQEIQKAHETNISLDTKKLSDDIKAALPEREFNSGDTREIKDILSTSFDKLKSPANE